MPNNVINEIIFSANKSRQLEIKSALCNNDDNVDFEILVPAPKNIWWGSCGQRHKKAFRMTHLDWARENWGTKWNAYSQHPIEETDEKITFRFETAWNPPYPWLAAVFNTLKISFEHNWLSEGGGYGVHGVFDYSEYEKGGFGDPWKEDVIASEIDPLHRHLHKLLWGCEEFTGED